MDQACQHECEELGSTTGCVLPQFAAERRHCRTFSSKLVTQLDLVSFSGTYEVTGMSPQSMTLAQELKGFALSGTLYPPLNPTLREPLRPREPKVSI